MIYEKEKKESMEKKPKVKIEEMCEVKPEKKSSSNYIALVAFETSEGKLYEAGDKVSGLKELDRDALIEMNAIEKEN